MDDQAERSAQKITAILGYGSLIQVRLSQAPENGCGLDVVSPDTLDMVRFRTEEIHGAASDLWSATQRHQRTREVDMVTVVNAHASGLVSSLRNLRDDPRTNDLIARKNIEDLLTFAEEIHEASRELWRLSLSSERGEDAHLRSI